MSRPIDYLESAVSDRPHSQMDRLLFEDEMSQQPQHFMRAYQEGYDPAKAIAEGDFMPMGLIGKIGKVGGYRGSLKTFRNFRKWLKEGASTPIDPKNLDEFRRVVEQRGGDHLKGGRQLFEQGQSYPAVYKGTTVPSNVGRSRKFGSRKMNPPIPERQKVRFQQGGPAERPPLLGYMNPSVQDETAHSQMDRLMFENELEQQPQYSMGIQQEVYDPAQAWGEGMMPIGGSLAMLKRSYGPYAKQAAHYRDILDKKLMNILKKYESQTRGRNIEKSLSTGAGQEATKEAMETDYIIQKLKGKYPIE